MNTHYNCIRIAFLSNNNVNLEESQLGIFYCVDHTIYYDSINLPEAEIYGDFKIYSGNHLYYWDKLSKEIPKLAIFDEYYFPRGRVMYNTKENIFQVLVDPCVINDDFLLSIIQSLVLDPRHTIILEDDHYVCNKCESERGYK